MTNIEIARKTIIEVASDDPYWSSSDEKLVNVEPTEDPDKFTFSVAGTFHSDYGCAIMRGNGKADIYYHYEDVMQTCEVCGWTPIW
jgi:hypothetical protein